MGTRPRPALTNSGSPVAAQTKTGVLVRVSLDEGVLTGKYAADHRFGEDDFRSKYFAGDRMAHRLEVAPPVISKIRHRRLPVGASLLIRMHEVSNLTIRELRILMGDRREKFRISDKQFKPKSATSDAALEE